MNDQYPALYASFQWHVPVQLNIAQLCVQRWAANPLEGRRPAVFLQNEFDEAQRCSYSELAATTGKLASGLRRMGVVPGDRVAVAMAQGPEFVAACMAVLAAGGVVLPLQPVLTTQQITHRITDARVKVAIVDALNVPGIVQAQASYPALSQIIGFGFQHEVTLSWSSLLARQPDEFRVAPTVAQSPAFLLYPLAVDVPATGVVIPHSALIGLLPGFVASQNWFPQHHDVFWTQSDWSSPEGLLEGLLPCLYFGHPIVALRGVNTVQRSLEILAHYNVTNINVPWSSLRAVTNDAPDLDPSALSLRAIVATGSHPGVETHNWFENRLGLSPNQAWGWPEAPYVLGHSFRWPARPGSLGRPYPGHLVSVLDTCGRVCPSGVTGEIAVNRFDIQGFPDPVLFSGYWPGNTCEHERFHHDWFLTGSLAHIDRDGYFWFDGPGHAVNAPSGQSPATT